MTKTVAPMMRPTSSVLMIPALLISTNVLAQQVRMEAEDMFLDVMRTERLDSASNGEIINMKGPGVNGSALANFPGSSGEYDVVVVYHDENDGEAQLTLSIAGTAVDSWLLNQRISGARQATDSNRMTREVATGYSIREGDIVRIDAVQGNWDHANVDYVEFTPILASGRATVAKIGGDYENPLAAIDDIGVWCPDVVRNADGCILSIETGHYVLDRTLVVPDGMAVTGNTAPNTVLAAAPGLAVAVVLGNDSDGTNTNLGNITIENRYGTGATSTGVRLGPLTPAVIQNVYVIATGSDINVAIDAGDEEATGIIANATIEARSGSRSTGVLATFLTIENSVVTASDAGVNIGVFLNIEEGGQLSMTDTTVHALGGQSTVGITQNRVASGNINISRSSITAGEGTTNNRGISTGGLDTTVSIRETHVRVRGVGSSSNVGISYNDPSGRRPLTQLSRLTVDVLGGGDNVAFEVSELVEPLTLTASRLRALGGTSSNVGILLDLSSESALSVGGSRITAPSASFRASGRGADSFLDAVVRFSFSTLEGLIVVPADGAPSVTCSSVTDENQAFLLDTCPPLTIE